MPRQLKNKIVDTKIYIDGVQWLCGISRRHYIEKYSMLGLSNWYWKGLHYKSVYKTMKIYFK